MSKIKRKTVSSCKKRFKITGTGKILFKNTGKGHNMRKRSQRQIRENRHKDVLAAAETKSLLKNFLFG